LSCHGFRLYAIALMWSVSNRTDGVVEDADLGLLVGVDASAAGELVESGLWRRVGANGGRYVIVDFASTQTPRDQLEGLERKRQQDRARAQRYRDKRRTSRDSSRDDKGQDRLRQARTGQATTESDGSYEKGLVHERDSAVCTACGYWTDSVGHELACLGARS
jgi:hypothetical protein